MDFHVSNFCMYMHIYLCVCVCEWSLREKGNLYGSTPNNVYLYFIFKVARNHFFISLDPLFSLLLKLVQLWRYIDIWVFGLKWNAKGRSGALYSLTLVKGAIWYFCANVAELVTFCYCISRNISIKMSWRAAPGTWALYWSFVNQIA